MSIGAGDGVETVEAAVGAEPRREEQWSARVLAAFGGAVVVVCLLVLGSAWSTGLRPSFLEKMSHANVTVDPMLFHSDRI